MRRSVDEHLRVVLDTVQPLPPFEQQVGDVLDLVLCEDVSSPVDLPGFDNSAMDGYAVRAADLAEVSPEHQMTLPVTGEIAAGQPAMIALAPGTAARIMTGAPIPHGADAVVPVEWTDGGIAHVAVAQRPEPGNAVRLAGEDLHAGDQVLTAGTVLGPRQVGLLAGIGRARALVRPRPRVVVISSGDELVEPGHPLGEGHIYDSNSYTLAAAARRAGAVAYRVGSVADDAKTVTDTLEDQLVRADVVITSGGVSKGAYDTVKEVLSKLGTVDFPEVAMQPGKPQGFGVIGEDRTPIFTLPGNPVSAYVSFEVFVRPALRKMMGREPYTRTPVSATVAEAFTSAPGKRQFARGYAEPTAGGWEVQVVGGHGSHLLGSLAQSNALVVIPEQVTGMRPGEQVEVWLLDEDLS
jgi:molybdopterin molybdotransferase